MLRFYTANICPFASRTHIALLESLTPDQFASVQICEIDLQNKPDWYYQVNPQLKVPALQIGDKTLIESLIITEYVLETFGKDTNLLPKDPMERYSMRLFIEQFSSLIVQPFYQLLRSQNSPDQAKAKENLLNGIKSISKSIKGPFVSGNNFSMADIATIPWPLRFEAIEFYRGFTIPDEPDYLEFKNWVQNCLKRDSVKANIPRSAIEGYKGYVEGK